MKQKMSHSQVASNISKYDSFVSTQLLHLHKISPSKECLQNRNDSNFENEQKEIRRPAKKISFKIKKNPSFCRRRTVDVQRNSSNVAQLTQKFNSMIVEKDEFSKPTTKASQINKTQDSSIKYNTLPTRPSIRTNLVDKTLKPKVNVLKTNENNSRNQRNFVSNNPEPSTNKKCECVQQRRQTILRDKIETDDCDEVVQNIKNNVVQAAINIFERRTSLCDNRNSIQAINSNVRLNMRKEQHATVSNNIKRIIENNVHNNNNNINSDIFKGIYTVNKSEAKEDIKRIPLSDVPQLHENVAKEMIAQDDCAFEHKSEKKSNLDSTDFSNIDLPITPNSSFLWRDKGSAQNNIYAEYSPVKLRPKSDSALIKIETSDFSSHLRPQICNDMQDCTEGIYEKINVPSTEDNFYEIMYPVQFKQGERTSIGSANSPINVSETENSISNCYESIYTRDYKANADGECIYESVYERMLSCSNRDSLVSCEQNSNSLYGKTLWESEDDSSIYKPVSDLSDDWIDITDNEESHNNKSGIIIKYEKQRNRKSTWSQHLREQWAKTYSPVSVTVDVESDPDHHYESLYSKKEPDDDYDSFESDSCSEHSFKSGGEYYIQNALPKPPNSQPYGIIKFAGKHMKKLKRRSIDLSKSLSRMTKRISRTDINISGEDKYRNPQSTEPKMNEYTPRESLKNQPSSKSHVENSVIYENVDTATDPTQKSGGEQEKERLSLLKRIRRSMSMSTESALELTSNLSNKPRSTFYLTEVIDIDKNENDEKLTRDVTTVSKINIPRPKSPPPEVPIKNKEANKTSITENIYEENENKSRTCWYREIELYKGPDTTPSTSTAENSGSGTSNLDINQDSEDYYNMINRRYSKSDNINVNESDEEKCSLDDRINCTTPDIQLLLQDEPLYQFYDAAVLESIYQDGTHHFETDNYEDVDNFSELSSNSGSSPEQLVLSKKSVIPFTKTFWCEVPEVIQSSVLSKLSVRQKKLQEAKFEIITSEASYVNSLNVLNDHFALSLKECDFINEKEWQIMFGKVASVKTCSQRLLQELEKCWQDNILLYGICDVLQKQVEENFNVFIPYCENQILLGDTLNKLMERPGFENYLKQLESNSSCHSLTLYSFLMLPMQRITRWPLLVDAMLKRLSQSDPEYVVCQYALATLNKIVNQCNEAARKKEREIELQTIANKLEFSKGVTPLNIISQDRWLVRSGTVMSIQQKSDDSKMTFGKRFNKIQLCLYLFNDMFLVTKEKSNEVHTVLHYCPRNLVELRDADMLLPKKDGYEKNLLFLTVLENQDGKTIEFVLSCNKESDKERWIEAISPPKSEDPEETLYECWDCPQVIASHNYTSVQPDELSLSRGDTINVLRKMGDGWYHGERIRDGQTGWFPANYTSEIMNPHVRARNLKQRYRLLAFSENYLKTS